MTSVRITPAQPTINRICVVQVCRQFSSSCGQRIAFSRTRKFSCPSLKLSVNAAAYQKCVPTCSFGGRGKSENDKKGSPWEALEKAVGGFKKTPSIEEVLWQQIEKKEYYDDGGSSGDPPRGGGGDGFSSGDDFDGSEDEGLAGTLDEILQVFLATTALIFLYIYILNGEEINVFVKDLIKYLFRGTESIRLKRAMSVWERFLKSVFGEKIEDDPYWLEREIINTPTWWDGPEKYRRILEYYVRSSRDQSDQ